MTELSTIKDVATIAAPFTKMLVDTWVTPKISSLLKTSKAKKKINKSKLSSRFKEYLTRSYEKHSYLKTLVFPNQQKLLLDLYIPLIVKSTKDQKTFVICEYEDEFIPTYRNILITDTAGMGKSTILKKLFLSCIEKNQGIPILIELRRLSKDNTVLDIIFNELNPINEEFDKSFILRLIKEGDFVFFLDGFDEISLEHREDINRGLQDFKSKAGKNIFVLTSRPEVALGSFPEFQQFTIEPLTKEKAFGLIKKYDQNQALSKKLIQEISECTLKNIDEFLGNPFLISLLYKSYSYKQTIPFKKHIFYRQVYDSLFENHDLTKEGGFVRPKHSGLDIEDFHRVLRVLGYLMVQQNVVEVEKDRLLTFITESKQHTIGINFKESLFLKDLVTTVPLFSCEGNYYRWAHKSVQEYFAAHFICIDLKEKQSSVLLAMYNSKRIIDYVNILDLCYDIDYKTFLHTIVLKLINDFLSYCQSSYIHKEFKQIPKEMVNARKILTFTSNTVLGPAKLSETFINALSSENDNAFKQLSKKYKLTISLSNGWVIHSGGKLSCFVFRDQKSAGIILQILINKNNKLLFSQLKFKDYNDEWFEIMNKFVSNEVSQLSDDPLLPFNSEKLFHVVNNALLYTSRNWFLDFKKCKTMKNKIDSEIKNEKLNNFYLNHI